MTVPKKRTKIVIAVFLAGMFLLNGMVLWRAWWQVVAGYPDYTIFYTAGLMLRRNQGEVLYNNSVQLQVQREFAPVAQHRDGPLPYNHPAFEAMLFVPLTYLPYVDSYKAWVGVNLCLLVAMALFLRKNTPEVMPMPLWMLVLATVAFFPVAYALMQGQDSVLLLAIYSLTYVMLRKGRDLQAGVWLGLGLFKFHLVLPFVFILLLRRRWRFVSGVALSACFELLLSWALVGWRELLYYPRYTWEMNRHPPKRVILPEDMANLRGLFTGWNWSQSASAWLEIAALVASLGLLVWAARRWDPADREPIAWNNGFSIAVLATFLASYHGYKHDMSILFLPLLVLSCQALQSPAKGWPDTALKLGLGLMFFSPAYLILTLDYNQGHLFALVILELVVTLAAWNASLESGRSLHAVSRS